MKRPAVFFDRDNTLIASDGYLGDPAGVNLIDGAADAIARVRSLGFATVTFSNQSGVARGLFGEEAVHAVNSKLDELLQDENQDAVIDRHEFCPFHPDATVEKYKSDSDLRKPKPGMIHQAAAALDLDLARSWVIGDAPRDVEAGRAAGCRTILVRNPHLPRSPAAEAPATIDPDHTVDTIDQAISLIAAAEIQARQPRVIPSPAPITPAPEPAPIVSPTVPTSPAAPVAAAVPAPAAAIDKPPLASIAQPEPAVTRHELAQTLERLEDLSRQMVHEMRRRHEEPNSEFSVSKLLGGIVQVIALATLFIAYFRRDDVGAVEPTLLVALVLQTLTIALLIMGKQR